MTVVIFAVALLATWRLTCLLVFEAGPFDVFSRFRAFVGVTYDEFSRPAGRNVVARALSCHRCASVWAGAIIALAVLQTVSLTVVLYALALSAGSILIQTHLEAME